ncbi:GNAT family N-acetyltransferase [Salinibacillus xinjiangensis]|uniref:GNAT family N-acetyltransferase n=1 Tax=Salinibacillus xinjiangensis TaxID=1229268 RepID=A0A6G1X540_9BACI|nr:GNAT family N-acetyltransferase [Salinibacillus xinjiangensis]MRG86057.1 GNAT family N-acetyltransferase [Salinibacillus xinjiangensis]
MNTLLIDVPLQIETDRLILRAPHQNGDGKVVNRAIRDSIEELRAWLPFAQKVPSVEQTEVNLRKAHIRFLQRESFRFLIFHKNTSDYIGRVSYESVDWDIPKCEIGYWIHTLFSGQGYMTEAVEKLISIALYHLQFNRLEIRCESTNIKSRSIPEKLGFELEGILKNEDLSADGSTLTDTCIYGITR